LKAAPIMRSPSPETAPITTGRGNFSNIRPAIRRAQFLPPTASN